MIRNGKTTFILLLCAVSVYAVDISLSGTVKDSQGKAVVGAIVTTAILLPDSIDAITDSEGHFTLVVSNMSARNIENIRRQAIPQFVVKNNILEFSTPYRLTSGKLDILTMDGKVLLSEPLKQTLTGKQKIIIPSHNAFGFYIVRLNVNGILFTGKLISVGKWIFTLKGFDYDRTIESATEAKITEIIDTLFVFTDNSYATEIPISSYTQSGINVTINEGVLRKLFLINDNIVSGWKVPCPTVNECFTLWNNKNFTGDINGGAVAYTDLGMLQAADVSMTGPNNASGDPVVMTDKSTFVMDFGTEAKAKAMFFYKRDDKYVGQTETAKVQGYNDSIAFATTSLAGATIFSYKKQFYFEVCVDNFDDLDMALDTAKKFLEYFLSKVP